MKFKHIASAQVRPEAVSRVYFPEIDGSPWLEVRPAGETNKAYLNRALAGISKSPGSVRSKMTVEEIQKERADSIPLYAAHVLTGVVGGWISDETGEEVASPLSVEDRESLLRALPVDLYDRVRTHCNDLTNFRG